MRKYYENMEEKSLTLTFVYGILSERMEEAKAFFLCLKF